MRKPLRLSVELIEQRHSQVLLAAFRMRYHLTEAEDTTIGTPIANAEPT